MSFRVVHDAVATMEFREAVAWYEAESEGRGVRFVREVDKVINSLRAHPLFFSKASRNSRKARVIDWPQTIYFAVNEDHQEVKVIAVWHGARNPAELRKRLK